MNLSELSDEQLFELAGLAPSADPEPEPTQVAGPAAGSAPDVSKMSNEELLRLLGGDQGGPGGFDPGRFIMEKGQDNGQGLGRGLKKTARDLRMGKSLSRSRPGAGASTAIGALNNLGMGWADEIAGGILGATDTVGDMIAGRPTSLTERYRQGKQAWDNLADDAWQDHPVAYGAGAVPGFVASGLLLPELKGATAATRGLKTGALYGGIAGFGEGEGLTDSLYHGAIGAGGGALIGNVIGRGVDRLQKRATDRAISDLTEEAAASVAQRDADQFGIGLTRGQATGNVKTLATENAMRDVAHGEEAAKVANKALARQRGEIIDAGDTIAERLAGTDANGLPRPVIDHPSEAGERLIPSITQAARSGEAQIAAGNAADQQLARTAADTIETGLAGGSRQASDLYDVGDLVGEGVRARQAASAAARDAAYADAAAVPGEIQRQGIEGLGQRIREVLTTGSQRPVIINSRTPAAQDALNLLDDLASFRAPRNDASPFGALPADPSAVTHISPAGVENVRQQLVALSQQARAAARTGDASDYHAMRAIMDAFDQQLERIVRYRMFDGDPRWLDLYRYARGLHAEHRATFRPEDALRGAMRDIVDNNATPEQVANYLYGRSAVGDTRTAAALVDHLRTTLGDTSPEFQAIKQGGWQRLIGGRDMTREVTHETAQQIANDIDQFLTNRGRSFAEALYSDGERQIMARYAQGLRNMATSRRTPPEALQTMIDLANRNVQPPELARLVSGGTNKNTLSSGSSNRLLQTFEDVFGRDSDEWSLVKQAVWRNATANADGNDPKTAYRLAENITELLNGNGRAAATRLFEPAERDMMAAYARTLRRIAGNRNADNPSKTASKWWQIARDQGTKIAFGLGMMGGGLMHALASAGVAQVGKSVGEKVNGMRAERLFNGARDLSLTRGLRDSTNAGLRRIGTGTIDVSGQIGSRAAARADRAIAGDDEQR